MKNKNMQVLHSSPKTRRTPPAAGFATGLCFYKLFWIFLVGCVIGCLVEMLWCYLNEGFFESRQGLIYGPFSPVYGLGAVLFTLVMYRFKHSSSFIIFLVSAVVRSYGWMVILGTNGLLNQLLQSLGLISAPLKILNTETAVIIGMIHLLVPYMVLSLVGVLQSIDPNVEYAAYSLGASPLQTFSKVVFPLSLPGIISGCVLVFTMSMTSYVTPKLLGGSKFRMMATMVVQEINVNFDWGAASAISYILLAVILLVQIAVVLCTSGYMKRMGGGK